MIKLMLCFLLMASELVAATNYLTIVYSETLKDPDKTVAKLNSKTLFQDATEVSWESMSRFRSIADTSVLYRAVHYSVDVGTVKKNVTKKDVEDNVKDKTSEPDKITVVPCGMNSLADLRAFGIEPIIRED